MLPLPNPLSIPYMLFTGMIIVPFAIWGYRHGVQSVIISGLFVVVARISADTFAKVLAPVVNFLIRLLVGIFAGKLSRSDILRPLNDYFSPSIKYIDFYDPNNIYLTILATGLFAAICYTGFKFAARGNRERDTFLSSLFGLIGGIFLGTQCIDFLIGRFVVFPQIIEIYPSEVPTITINATTLVVLILVLAVFGVQLARAEKVRQ